MPRRLLQAKHTVRVRRRRTAEGRHDHRVHGRQVTDYKSTRIPFDCAPPPHPPDLDLTDVDRII